MATKPKYELIGKKKWNILYPLYINSKKSLTEGRRIPKADGVENPSAVNLYEAIKSLGFECDFEPNKTHPKDFAVNGRVRVKIYNDDDTPTNPEYPTKDDLLRKIGKVITTRAQGGAGGGDQSKKKKGKGK